MATVWVRAEPANHELGAEERGNTESGKQSFCPLELSQKLTKFQDIHLNQTVGEYISIEHQIQWKMNRLQGCNFDGL